MKRFAFVITIFCFCSQATFAEHIGDILVGVSGSNQLKVKFVPECEEPLTATSNHIYSGWLSGGLESTGFDNLDEDDPNNDIYVMQGSHDIHLELISIKNYVNEQDMTGFYAIDVVTYNWMADPCDDPLRLGSSDLHIHLTWYINNDENKAPWVYSVDPNWIGRMEVTFKLIDSVYADSDPFTMVFSNDEYMIADINQDGTINMEDFAALGAQWQQSGCVLPDRCERADVNQDGQVGLEDLSWLTYNWLLNDPNCSL